jgi:hypothetical protein
MTLEDELKNLWKSGTKSLDIYWLEDNKPRAVRWWCDVMCDTVYKNEWVWTVISRAEHENDLPDTCSNGDWFIIVDEDKYSDDIVKDTIQNWLHTRGFQFQVNVVSSEGTNGERHMLEMIKGMN